MGSGGTQRRPAVPVLSAGAAAVLLAVPWSGVPAGSGMEPPPGPEADPGAVADTTVVGMTNALNFTPDSVVVRPGATVVWKNTSVLVHTMTAVEDSAADPADVRLPESAEPFGSDRLGPDETYRHTFTVPGTYRYICIPHEAAGMVGTVVVEVP